MKAGIQERGYMYLPTIAMKYGYAFWNRRMAWLLQIWPGCGLGMTESTDQWCGLVLNMTKNLKL